MNKYFVVDGTCYVDMNDQIQMETYIIAKKLMQDIQKNWRWMDGALIYIDRSVRIQRTTPKKFYGAVIEACLNA